MKRTSLLLVLLAALALTTLALTACSNHPNNGEIPPASELPTPFPTASSPPPAHAASTRPAPSTSAPVAASSAMP